MQRPPGILAELDQQRPVESHLATEQGDVGSRGVGRQEQPCRIAAQPHQEEHGDTHAGHDHRRMQQAAQQALKHQA